MPLSKAIVWFRNDLRIRDNEVLFKASQKYATVIPIYCFDPRQFQQTFLGFPKTDKFRAKFIIESVADLKKSLQGLGSDLVVLYGHPEELIPELAEKLAVSVLYCSKEVTQEEVEVENKMEKNLWQRKILLQSFWTSSLFHIEDLGFPIHALPNIFSDFRKQAEKTIPVRAAISVPEKLFFPKNIDTGKIPTLEELSLANFKADSRISLTYQGGESAGLKRLDYYIWEKKLIKNYKETRNGLLGADYSSRFSAWLSLGCISPRTVYEAAKRFEQTEIKNESTYWLIFELMWRDYFRFVAKKFGNKLFQVQGIKNQNLPDFIDNPKAFSRWINGETGVPFIDANMRELKFSGFMSNRGRQNVASFLVKDLKINWTYGAMYFESQLIDYDVCSNWGNWNYVAGVGNDPRENRYFNILSQAKRYDGKGTYVKQWLPELQKIPHQNIHYPTNLSLKEQKIYKVKIGKDYPSPLIDFERWMDVGIK